MKALIPGLVALVLSAPAVGQNLALALDGDGDFVSVPDHPDLEPAQALTIEGWVGEASSGANRIVTKGDGIRAVSDRSYDLSLVNGGIVRAWVFLQGGKAATVDAPLGAAGWHHVAMVWSGGAGSFDVLVDGVVMASTSMTADGSEPLLGKALRGSSQPVFIGRQSGFAVWDFDGRVDGLRLWNVARTSAQIRCTMNTEITAATSGGYPGLVAVWNFQGNAQDELGTHHGALNGDASFAPADDVPIHSLTETYCTAKPSSCGTLPAISATGGPSATAMSGFVVMAEKTRGGKTGLLLYTENGRGNVPFSGGTLCLATPLKRTVVSIDTVGTPGQCDGVLSIDMNAFARGLLGGNPLSSLSVPGTLVDCQFWARDTPGNSLLSDALEYLVCQ